MAGIPIQSAVQATVTPGHTAQGITNAIWEGIKSGVTSVGVNMATQALGLDSFAGTLVSRTLSGAIAGAISPSHNVFQGVYNAFRNSVGNFNTIPPPPDPEDPHFIKTLDSGQKIWNQAAYNQAIVQYEASRPVWMAQAMAKTNNFNDDIREHGLAAAVENYATSIFHRDSVESLVQSFGSIAESVRRQLADHKEQEFTLPDGTKATKVPLTPDGLTSILTQQAQDGQTILVGIIQGDEVRLYDEARVDRQTLQLGMRSGTVSRTLADGSKLTLEVRNGQVTKARLVRGDQHWLFTGNEVGDLQISPDGKVFAGQLIDETTGVSFVFRNGQLESTNELSTVALISLPELQGLNAANSAMAQLEAKTWGLYSPDPIQPTNITAQQTVTGWEHFVDGNLREAAEAILGRDLAEPLLTDLKTLGKQTIENSTASGSTPSDEFQQRLASTENQIDKLLDAIQQKLESSANPMVRSLGGYTVGLFQGFGDGISSLSELATNPIGSLITFGQTVAQIASHPRETASAIQKNFQAVLSQSRYEQGRTIGRLAGAVVFGLVTDGVIGKLSAGSRFAEGASYTAEDLANIQRSRVLANVAESKAARAASNFELLLAKEAQIKGGYNPDNFSMLYLRKGDVVYGGLPGRSAFYTDAAALEASGLDRVKFFQSLQVTPSTTDWYRPQVGVYKLTEDVRVPGGIALANHQAGPGGQAQFFIKDFETKLELADTIDLK